jgi:hypothetical protein
MRGKLGLLPASLALSLTLVPMSAGVATAGELVGVLEAPSGTTAFPVPDVEMRLCSPATDECRKTYTGSEGAFRFSEIAPGRYRLEAETRSGVIFETVTVSGSGQNVVRMVIP